MSVPDDVDLLRKALERAERDAQRWERCAVAAEAAANDAHRRRRESEAEVDEMRKHLRHIGEGLVEALDELAGRVARILDVSLPSRWHDDEDDEHLFG